MHANHREEREEIGAGEIAAAVGLKFTTTGDTLTDPAQPDRCSRRSSSPSRSSRSRSSRRRRPTRTSSARRSQRLAEEDPTFRVKTDEETGQTLIAGMGELHLEIIVDRLLREFKVDANVGKPQVAYRETIKRPAEHVRARFVRQTGGRGQFGDVDHRRRAERPARATCSSHKIVGGAIPKEYIPAGRPGHQGGDGGGRPRRLPGRRHQGRARRRVVPRRRLVGDGVQDRRLDGLQGGHGEGAAGAARADLRRRGHRRPRSTWAT